MIPTFDVARAAIAPYLMWAKIVVVSVAVGLLIWGYLTIRGWQQDSHALAAAVAHEKAVVAQAAQTLAQLQTRFDNAQKASQEFQNDLSKIRAERDRLRNLPVRSVRLCVAGPVPAPGASAGRSDGAAPGPAPQPATAGPDIGRDLYGIADDADQREAELAAQIVRLQGLLTVH